MIMKETSFTYRDMMKLLSDSEVKLLLKLIEHMTDDNLLYLYQRASKRDGRQVITKVAEELGVSRKTVQNGVSSIISKQDDDRYFLYRTNSGIRGEYFISPELVVRSADSYDNIYTNIIPKLIDEK